MPIPDFTEPLTIEIELARQIRVAAYEMLPHKKGGDARADLTSALAHIALEHVEAILFLFANGAFASGYALMRPALETTYKCFWIDLVAAEADVSRAYRGHDAYPALKKIISEIEAEFEETDWADMFGKIRSHMRALHERTHSGGEQTLRRLVSQDMSIPGYEFGEVIRDIRTLAAAAILAAFPVVTLSDAQKLNALMLANYPFLNQLAGDSKSV